MGFRFDYNSVKLFVTAPAAPTHDVHDVFLINNIRIHSYRAHETVFTKDEEETWWMKVRNGHSSLIASLEVVFKHRTNFTNPFDHDPIAYDIFREMVIMLLNDLDVPDVKIKGRCATSSIGSITIGLTEKERAKLPKKYLDRLLGPFL